jgi:hypothetical protein
MDAMTEGNPAKNQGNFAVGAREEFSGAAFIESRRTHLAIAVISFGKIPELWHE